MRHNQSINQKSSARVHKVVEQDKITRHTKKKKTPRNMKKRYSTRRCCTYTPAEVDYTGKYTCGSKERHEKKEASVKWYAGWKMPQKRPYRGNTSGQGRRRGKAVHHPCSQPGTTCQVTCEEQGDVVAGSALDC